MNLHKPYKYNDSYILLPLDLDINGLHSDIVLFGDMYYLKSEFHVSLVCVKNILEEYPHIDKNKILTIFNNFIVEHTLDNIQFINEYRLASHSDGRKSIVQKVTITNIELLFDVLRNDLGIQIDTQPVHITIYTLQKDKGIGINRLESYNNTLEIRFK